MSLEIRTLDDSDLGDWIRAVNTGFLRADPVTEEEVEARRPGTDVTRTQGAYEHGRCVATFRSMPRELTVPGGALVDSTAITNVSVTATHRRRGLLTRMMTGELTVAKERGEALAILIAAEYPIYGRFGFGPATWATEWEIELSRAQLPPFAHPEGGRIDLVDPAEAAKLGPELHERVRRLTPGAINRTDRWWLIETGQVPIPSRSLRPLFFAVYRDDATGRVDGMAAYRADETWNAKLPAVNLTVPNGGLIAATPEAEVALWRYLMSVDWVARVKTGLRAPDDIVPLLLGDPRAARTGPQSDLMWLRFLDTPRALSARTYAAPGTLVLDVDDPMGLAGGRYRLEALPDSTATCAPTDDPADLTLSMSGLGALYLGDESAVRLATLGRASEARPGAAACADLLFRTSRRPWCPDIF